MTLPNPHLLLCTVITGSRAYGTEHESSDIDRRGVFVGSPILKDTVYKDLSEKDAVYFELSHWACRLDSMNPFEFLWALPERAHPLWVPWVARREQFLSSQLVLNVAMALEGVRLPSELNVGQRNTLCHLFRYARILENWRRNGVFSLRLDDVAREWYLGVKRQRDPQLTAEMQSYLKDSGSRLKAFSMCLPPHPNVEAWVADTLTQAWGVMYGHDKSCATASESTGSL